MKIETMLFIECYLDMINEKIIHQMKQNDITKFNELTGFDFDLHVGSLFYTDMFLKQYYNYKKDLRSNIKYCQSMLKKNETNNDTSIIDANM